MSYKTIYTCDKCGKEQLTMDQFWTVGVSANCATYPATNFVTGKFLQVCRPCLESFGIHVQQRPANVPPAPEPPSLEDLIREIVRRATEEYS